MTQIIVTIDGPAGTGKSTIAKALSRELGITYFDTGAMYRTFALYLLSTSGDTWDHAKIKELLPSFQFDVKMKEGNALFFLNGEEVTHAIRTPEVTQVVSQVASFPEVREAMRPLQRNFGAKQDAIFEGRDIGTVVFPDAPVKIFLNADPKVRAERRYLEMLDKFPEMGDSLDFEQVLAEINTRDESDRTRKVGPLKMASDAVEIDTTYLTPSEIVELIVRYVEKKRGVDK